MRRAIGFIIVLWGISVYFGQAMHDFGAAASASFKTVEVAAGVAQTKLTEI